jgi:hypothetical protein
VFDLEPVYLVVLVFSMMPLAFVELSRLYPLLIIMLVSLLENGSRQFSAGWYKGSPAGSDANANDGKNADADPDDDAEIGT